MQCRVTNNRMLALHSTTKEEQVVEASKVEEELEEMVEVEDQSIVIIVDNKDIMIENATNPSQYVSIANLMNISWKTSLSYRGCGRKRDRSWKTRIFS